LPVREAENVKTIAERMEALNKIEDPELREIELAKVKRYIAELTPPTFRAKGKSLQMINLLLNTKTMGRNIKGNVVMAGLETVKDIPGSIFDKLISKKTGERTTLLPTKETVKTKFKVGVKEAKKTVVDAKHGIDRSQSLGQYDLPMTKAFRKIENPKGVKQKVNNVLSKAEDVTRFGLSAGDRPFYAAAYEDSMRTQKILTPEKSEEEMIKQAHKTAEHSTFQNNSNMYKALNSIKQGLNKIGNNKVLGDIIIPFVKTPANVIDKAIDYTPLGGIRGIVNLTNGMKKGTVTQKEVVDQLGRSLTGTTLMTVGVLLAQQGVLTGKQDSNSNISNFKKQAGITPYSIKIGNKYSTIDWVQPAAVPLMLGADIYQTLSKEKDSDIAAASLEAVKTGLSTTFNQSLLQGLTRLFGGYSSNSGENLLEGITNAMLQAPGQFVPFNSALKQVTQLTDNTYRDTNDSNPILKEGKKIIAKLPGLSKTLPARVDLLGREQKTYDSTNTLDRLNDVFNRGGFKNTYNPTNAEKVILNLYEKNKNTDLIPKKAPTKITVNKKTYTLNAEEQRKYQTIMGKEVQERLKADRSYSEKEVINIIEYAKEKAKKDIMRNKK